MKYIGSPFGQIKGKLNGTVGISWKGIDSGRVLKIPCSRGSLIKYKLFKAGTISDYSFSYKQMNIRHAVVNFLGFMSRKYYDQLKAVWIDYLTKHPGLKLGPMNAFVKANASPLYNSMSDIDAEYNASSNAPDLTKMLVSMGDLEPIASITSAKYTSGTGALVVVWDGSIYGNGLATDKVFWAVARKPILESVGTTGTWRPTLFLHGMTDTTDTRTDAGTTITLPTGLTAADLTLYLYCQDAAGTIGYSDSKGFQITVP